MCKKQFFCWDPRLLYVAWLINPLSRISEISPLNSMKRMMTPTTMVIVIVVVSMMREGKVTCCDNQYGRHKARNWGPKGPWGPTLLVLTSCKSVYHTKCKTTHTYMYNPLPILFVRVPFLARQNKLLLKAIWQIGAAMRPRKQIKLQFARREFFLAVSKMTMLATWREAGAEISWMKLGAFQSQFFTAIFLFKQSRNVFSKARTSEMSELRILVVLKSWPHFSAILIALHFNLVIT